jgi:hypothetical protein
MGYNCIYIEPHQVWDLKDDAKYPPWIVLIISEEISLRVTGKEKFPGGHTFFSLQITQIILKFYIDILYCLFFILAKYLGLSMCVSVVNLH